MNEPDSPRLHSRLLRRRRDTSPGSVSAFEIYRDRFSATEGWFSDESQVIWDFLLSQQWNMSVAGGFMEVGVWKGKSAFMGALHMAPDQPVVLVDTSNTDAVVEAIRTFHPGDVVSLTARSSTFRSSDIYPTYRGGIRFFHVDGEHSGAGTYADLTVASEMVGSQALIAIDDFGNMRYPQLHAATYKFLFSRPEFRMVLCGGNKAYFCRTEDFALYDELIRKFLVPHTTSLGVPLTLARTSYAHDYGCFAVELLATDRPLIGRDEDPDVIVF
jgi:hypothetical protein